MKEPQEYIIPPFEEVIEQLVPSLDQMEEQRQQAVGKFYTGFWISLLCIIPLAFILGLMDVLPEIDIVFSLVMGITVWLICLAVIYAIVVGDTPKKLRWRYKQEVIPAFIKAIMKEGEYDPCKGISKDVFTSSGLYPTRIDKYNAEDLISGKIGDTQIHFSEVHAQQKQVTTDSKGRSRTRWTTVFRGFIFVSDFNKNFHSHTLICRKNILTFRSLSRVRLEDPDFEKSFRVYSTDQVDARYILSLSLMERIKKLEKKYKGQGLVLSFCDSRLIIMVRDFQNRFESRFWNPINCHTYLKEEYEIIAGFTSIVEDLNLNLRIWSKV